MKILSTILLTLIAFSSFSQKSTLTERQKKDLKKMVKMENNKLVALKGYKFEAAQYGNKVVLLRNNGGGGVKGSFSCDCDNGHGTCAISITPRLLICKPNSCTKCELVVTVGGVSAQMSTIFGKH